MSVKALAPLALFGLVGCSVAPFARRHAESADDEPKWAESGVLWAESGALMALPQTSVE